MLYLSGLAHKTQHSLKQALKQTFNHSKKKKINYNINNRQIPFKWNSIQKPWVILKTVKVMKKKEKKVEEMVTAYSSLKSDEN